MSAEVRSKQLKLATHENTAPGVDGIFDPGRNGNRGGGSGMIARPRHLPEHPVPVAQTNTPRNYAATLLVWDSGRCARVVLMLSLSSRASDMASVLGATLCHSSMMAFWPLHAYSSLLCSHTTLQAQGLYLHPSL